MNDYGPKNNRSYGCILVVNDNFSKIGWTIPLKNKYDQSITDAFSEINKSSNREPNLLETDDGKESVNKTFNEFLPITTLKDILAILIKELSSKDDLIELIVIYQKNQCLRKKC